MTQSPTLAALVASRIAHDLISPIGAIANGLELVDMVGTLDGAEGGLLRSSVQAANGRIRFFQVAYGLCDEAQMMKQTEVAKILNNWSQDGPFDVHFVAPNGMKRRDAQITFLMLQALENALPVGGQITLTVDNAIQIIADGPKVMIDSPQLQAVLSGNKPEVSTAAMIHYTLLFNALNAIGKQINLLDTAPLQFTI